MFGRHDRRPRQHEARRAPAGRSRRAGGAPDSATITGSTTTGCRRGSRSSAAADRLDARDRAEHPDLHGVDADVLGDRADLRDDHRRARRPRPRSTATVFCAVIAVIAVVPCTPARGERLQVGLDAGAAAGVRAGDGEADAGCGAVRRTRRRRIGPARGHHRGTTHVAAAGHAREVPEQLELGEGRERGCAWSAAPASAASVSRPPATAPSSVAAAARAPRAGRRAWRGDADRDVEHVGGVADERGAVAQQRVRARRPPRRDRARAPRRRRGRGRRRSRR